MKITETLTEDAVLGEVAQRIQRARLDRQMTQADLAVAAGVARATVERYEATGIAQFATLVRLLRALGLLDRLDAVLPETSLRPIEAFERKGALRKRASRPRKPATAAKPWRWGDEA